MKRKHNPKIAAIIGICLLIGISVVVINAHDMQTISRVKLSNQSIVIRQGNTKFSNEKIGFGNEGHFGGQNLDVNNSGDFNNTGVGARNRTLNSENTGNFNNAGVNTGNSGRLRNQGNFSNTSGNYGNNGVFHNNGSGINNSSSQYGNSNSEFENSEPEFGNQNYGSSSNRYKYQDIDWSTWKSNFVNRILDDSMYITSLDNYGVGTWFYYSFNVTDTGKIKNVTVFSFYLKEEDKKAVRDLIRSYAHKPITIFPKDSRRKIAKVKAIMLLGDTESKSDASNFNDIEKIKIKY